MRASIPQKYLRYTQPPASLAPAFVHIYVMRHRLDVVAMGEAAFGFSFGEHSADVIVPAEFGGEGVPHEPVGVVERASLFLAPLQDFPVTAALEDAGFQVVVGDVEEAEAPAVGALTEVLVQFLPKLALSVEPDLRQHSREVFQTAGFIERAAGQGGGIGFCAHARMA